MQFVDILFKGHQHDHSANPIVFPDFHRHGGWCIIVLSKGASKHYVLMKTPFSSPTPQVVKSPFGFLSFFTERNKGQWLKARGNYNIVSAVNKRILESPFFETDKILTM